MPLCVRLKISLKYYIEGSNFENCMCPMIFQFTKYKPCPFGSGLRKFALEFVIVFFFQKCRKYYKWWSDIVLRKNWHFAKNIYIVKTKKKESLLEYQDGKVLTIFCMIWPRCGRWSQTALPDKGPIHKCHAKLDFFLTGWSNLDPPFW